MVLASTNAGKLVEFQSLAAEASKTPALHLELLSGMDAIGPFAEQAPTFGENALGKALYYSRISDELVLADDSGLVVPALGGAPGVLSARYAGANASSQEKIAKLLRELSGRKDRAAYFQCVLAVAKRGKGVAIVAGRVDGTILEEARGSGGFGYDPVFYFPALRKTFSELSAAEKNLHSHRGKAFRRLLTGLSEH